MTTPTQTTVAPVAGSTDEEVTPADWLRILHVEDNPADARLAQEYLRGSMSAVEFDSAARLSELTSERATSADCALLDLSLPDATGLEALVTLRGLAKDLPIIVLTGFDGFELGLAALRNGADDFLIKNHVDGFTLNRAVRYAIERRGLMAEAVTAAADAAVSAGMLEQARVDEALAENAAGTTDREAGPSPRMAGTHEVAVRIAAEPVAYVLTCQSCGWEAPPAATDVESWAGRSLDSVLLSHMAFGKEAGVDAHALHDSSDNSSDAATADSDAGEKMTRKQRRVKKAGNVTRRHFFNSDSWSE